MQNDKNIWVHNKTGNYYLVLEENAIDCTNSRADSACVIYSKDGKVFVRDKDEFVSKFTLLAKWLEKKSSSCSYSHMVSN